MYLFLIAFPFSLSNGRAPQQAPASFPGVALQPVQQLTVPLSPMCQTPCLRASLDPQTTFRVNTFISVLCLKMGVQTGKGVPLQAKAIWLVSEKAGEQTWVPRTPHLLCCLSSYPSSHALKLLAWN